MKTKILFKTQINYLLAIIATFIFASCENVVTQEEPEILSSIEVVSLSSIELSSLPKKMTYNKGEYFSSKGLSVKAVYSNENFKNNFPFVLSIPDDARLMNVGSQEITVSSGNLKTSFQIEVKEAVRSKIKITKSPDKTNYMVGEKFDSNGIEVSEILTDDTINVLSSSDYTVSIEDGKEFTKAEKIQLKVSHKEFSDTITIQVYGVTEEDPENPEQYLLYTIENDEISIIGLTENCKAHNIVIPETIEGKSVTKIENLSPYVYKQVTFSPIVTLKIPASVKTICEYALYNVASLEEVEFSEGLKTIEQLAFSNCYALREIKIPESVTTIGSGAFAGCTALTSVEIAGKECIISRSAFSQCPIRNLSVANMHDVYEYSERYKYGIFSDKEKMIVTYTGTNPRIGTGFFDGAYVEKIIYPEGSENLLTTVGSYAFHDGSVAEKVLPEGITTLEDRAFSETSFYENRFVLPLSVETLKKEVFYHHYWEDCTPIEEFRFHENIKSIGVDSIPTCEKLIFAINIPDIEGDYPDANNGFVGGNLLNADLDHRIKIIEFEEGVTEIGEAAFYSRYNSEFDHGLHQIKLPSTIEKIGGGAFGDLKPVILLKDGKFDFPNLKYCAPGTDFIPADENGNLVQGEAVLHDMESITLPFDAENGWTLVTIEGKIEDCDFMYPKKLVVADSVTTLYGKSSYNELNEEIKNDLELFGEEIILGKGITFLPNDVSSHFDLGLFGPHGLGDRYAGKIRSVTITGDIKTIPGPCFYCCTNLTTVNLPDTLEIIESGAFMECPNLEKITIPASVKTIEFGAFKEYSEKIESYTYPYQLKEITVKKGYDWKTIFPEDLLYLETNGYLKVIEEE